MRELGEHLTGLERLRAMMTSDRQPGMATTLGMSIVEAQEGRVALKAPPGAHLANTNGVVQGGFAASLLDMACGYAVVLETRRGAHLLDAGAEGRLPPPGAAHRRPCDRRGNGRQSRLANRLRRGAADGRRRAPVRQRQLDAHAAENLSGGRARSAQPAIKPGPSMLQGSHGCERAMTENEDFFAAARAANEAFHAAKAAGNLDAAARIRLEFAAGRTGNGGPCGARLREGRPAAHAALRASGDRPAKPDRRAPRAGAELACAAAPDPAEFRTVPARRAHRRLRQTPAMDRGGGGASPSPISRPSPCAMRRSSS